MTVGLTEPTEKTADLAGAELSDTLGKVKVGELKYLPDECTLNISNEIEAFRKYLNDKYELCENQKFYIVAQIDSRDTSDGTVLLSAITTDLKGEISKSDLLFRATDYN